jgi:hypothetical protein
MASLTAWRNTVSVSGMRAVSLGGAARFSSRAMTGID